MTKLQAWSVQWRTKTRSEAKDPWLGIAGEEYNTQNHAELRKTGYWEKLSFAHLMEFRVHDECATDSTVPKESA